MAGYQYRATGNVAQQATNNNGKAKPSHYVNLSFKVGEDSLNLTSKFIGLRLGSKVDSFIIEQYEAARKEWEAMDDKDKPTEFEFVMEMDAHIVPAEGEKELPVGRIVNKAMHVVADKPKS